MFFLLSSKNLHPPPFLIAMIQMKPDVAILFFKIKSEKPRASLRIVVIVFLNLSIVYFLLTVAKPVVGEIQEVYR